MSKFIRLNQVKTITGLSRSSIYQFIKDGNFPSQVKLGARSVAWVASEIEEWMASCIAKRSNS
ncbi:helix-turn-helix transcriptional regulator [Nitrosomonas communis]|uniref:Prophage regulatory protein n=1 Tax=Nitrosomonas communis TaxID=44574 RepID=A0A1I4Q8Y2_9PROT|nr:AlpA family transcriptional regulator [Nitrosomonas communis]SFM36504.1 prophage regulatory protein [Nitrosomonas communis]